MNKIKIISDSSCDLLHKQIVEHSIELVPFSVSLDGVVYYKENIDITCTEFYEQLRSSKVFPKTSLPSVAQYIDAFKKHLDLGYDIFCICISSKLSGSYQSACNAKNILHEDYPNNKIIIIDSLQACISQGNLVLLASRLVKEDKNIEEVEEIIERNKLNCQFQMSISNLEYLQKGGRLSLASVFAGTLLNINPIIGLVDGELVPISKVRGKKRAMAELIDFAKKEIGTDTKRQLDFVCIDSIFEIEEIVEKLSAELQMPIEQNIYTVGVTIGAHVGHSVLGICITNYDV